jgi:hypothetical protein
MPRVSRFAFVLGGSLAAGCGASAPALEEAFFPVVPVPDGPCASMLERVEHADDPTALGFSAVEALQHLAGSRSSPLFWLEPPENQDYSLSYGPEQGRSTLALDLTLAEGPIYYQSREPRLGASEDTQCGAGALLIPVTVSLESAGQGLADRFETQLEAKSPYRGHLSKSLEQSVLRGSLGLANVSSLQKNRSFWLGPIRFEADVWEGGSAGSLTVAIGVRPAPSSPPSPALNELISAPLETEQPGPLAAWPSAVSCEAGAVALPPTAKVLGFGVDDVLARLNEGGPRQLTWSDGSLTAVRFELLSEEREPCQEIGETFRFGATLAARGAGGLDVRVPVRVEALDAGGAIGDIRVESADPEAALPIAPSADGAGTRFDARGYRSVLVAVEWSHGAGGDTGAFSLRGVDSAQPSDHGVYPSTPLESGRW